MTKVCENSFPLGSFKGQKSDGFAMDKTLKLQLDILLKNIVNDWDFTIVITGGGEVRVGKSVLAMQIAYYWTEQVRKLHKKKVVFNLDDNFVFNGEELIKTGNKLGKDFPFSVLIFDEAGSELEGRKTITSSTKKVLDYYRECGQYNLLNILVMPEFFDLPKGIALSRSIFLIDVYYAADDKGFFQRGFFNFYSRRNKKYLYLYGKKELNYKAHVYDFHGRFFNFYPVNEKEYRKKKQEAMVRRESKKRNKFQIQRDACWFLFNKEVGWPQREIAKRMEQLTGIPVARETITDGIRHFLLENE